MPVRLRQRRCCLGSLEWQISGRRSTTVLWDQSECLTGSSLPFRACASRDIKRTEILACLCYKIVVVVCIELCITQRYHVFVVFFRDSCWVVTKPSSSSASRFPRPTEMTLSALHRRWRGCTPYFHELSELPPASWKTGTPRISQLIPNEILYYISAINR